MAAVSSFFKQGITTNKGLTIGIIAGLVVAVIGVALTIFSGIKFFSSHGKFAYMVSTGGSLTLSLLAFGTSLGCSVLLGKKQLPPIRPEGQIVE